MVRAMEKANYDSIRRPFKFNVNHHPIEDFYLLKGVKEADGQVQMHIQQKVFAKHKDAYYHECKMQ